MTKLLTPGETALLIRKSPRALAVDRCRGRGLRYVRRGRGILYREQDVEDYIKAHLFEPDGTPVEKQRRRRKR